MSDLCKCRNKVSARPWILKHVNIAISYFLNICNILMANKLKVYSLQFLLATFQET